MIREHPPASKGYPFISSPSGRVASMSALCVPPDPPPVPARCVHSLNLTVLEGTAWPALAVLRCASPSRCFSARPCIVGEWSPWSGCAGQCRPTARVRRRAVQQEPQNGGAPCPALEERAGCLEYATPQGQDCGHAFGTALSFIAVSGW